MQNITTTPPVDLTTYYEGSANHSFRATIDSDGAGTFVNLDNLKSFEFQQNAFYPFEYDWESNISKGRIVLVNKDGQYGNIFSGATASYFVKNRKIKVYQTINYSGGSYEYLLFTALFDTCEYMASAELFVINIVGVEQVLKDTWLKEEVLTLAGVSTISVTDVKKYSVSASSKGVHKVVSVSSGDRISDSLWSYDPANQEIAFDKTVPQGSYQVYQVFEFAVNSVFSSLITSVFGAGVYPTAIDSSFSSYNLTKTFFTGKNLLRCFFELCQAFEGVFWVDYDGTLTVDPFPSGASVFEFRTDNTRLPGFKAFVDSSERWDRIIINGSNEEYGSYFDTENASPIASTTGTIAAGTESEDIEIPIPTSIRAESLRVDGAVDGTPRPTGEVLVGFQPGQDIAFDETEVEDTTTGRGLVLNYTDPRYFNSLYLKNVVVDTPDLTDSLDTGVLTLGFTSTGSAVSSGTISFARTRRLYKLDPTDFGFAKNVKGVFSTPTVEYSTNGGSSWLTATNNTHFNYKSTENTFEIWPVDHGLTGGSGTNVVTSVPTATVGLGTSISIGSDTGIYGGNSFILSSNPPSVGTWFSMGQQDSYGVNSYGWMKKATRTFLTSASLNKTNYKVINGTIGTTPIYGISGTTITNLRFSVTFTPQIRSNASYTFTNTDGIPEDSEVTFGNFSITGNLGNLDLNDVQLFVNRRVISSSPLNFVYDLTVSLLNDRGNTTWQFTCDWYKQGDVNFELSTAGNDISVFVRHTKETTETYDYDIYGTFNDANLDFKLIGIQNDSVWVRVSHNKGYADGYAIDVYGKELTAYYKALVEDQTTGGTERTLQINNQYIEDSTRSASVITAYNKTSDQKTIVFDKVAGLLPLQLCDKITIDPQSIYQAVSPMPQERYVRSIRWYGEYAENDGLLSEMRITAKEF